MPDLRPIHSKSPSSQLRASCLSKGISSALEQIWVALDRQGHWLSTQEVNWHSLWGRSRSKGTQTKHSIVLDSFTCFHHTLVLTVSNLLQLSYRLGQAHSRYSTQAVF